MNERFIKKLMTRINCAACGEYYKIKSTKVIGQSDDTWFLNVCCPACDSQVLVAAVVKQDRPLEVISDLRKVELDKFTQISTVNANDMLDLHNFLREFDGDFAGLFNYETIISHDQDLDKKP